MNFWYWFLIIIGIIFLLILIFGLPRKKSERTPSLEGLDNPEVAKAFERMTNFLPFKLLHRKVITQLKKYELQGTLVDLGCGSGNLIIQIAEKFPSLSLIGIDISSEILEFAEKRAIEKGMEGKIEFKNGAAEELPLSENSVNIIISTLSLHHWSDPLKVLNEIHRVLRKDGLCIIFDFRRDARKFFYGLFTFVAKVVVPKALKKVNEPLGSIKASYTLVEISEIFSCTPFQEVEIKPSLAWMFIKGKK